MPLRIIFFLAFQQRGVIITKHNEKELSERKMCAFSSKITIHHLLFDCLYAKFLWRMVHFLLGLVPPKDVHDLFIAGTNKGDSNKPLLLIGCATFLPDNMAYK